MMMRQTARNLTAMSGSFPELVSVVVHDLLGAFPFRRGFLGSALALATVTEVDEGRSLRPGVGRAKFTDLALFVPLPSVR